MTSRSVYSERWIVFDTRVILRHSSNQIEYKKRKKLTSQIRLYYWRAIQFAVDLRYVPAKQR